MSDTVPWHEWPEPSLRPPIQPDLVPLHDSEDGLLDEESPWDGEWVRMDGLSASRSRFIPAWQGIVDARAFDLRFIPAVQGIARITH